MKIRDVISQIEAIAPLAFQESYDNSGLCVGSPAGEVNGILITLDVTEEVIEEAIRKKADLIISHHPLIFQGLKRITGNTPQERCVIKAIRHGIAVYCAHTNMDNVIHQGVNEALAAKIGLSSCRVLVPLRGHLCKLVTFVPHAYAETVRNALFEAGAGQIGNYDCCSYNLQGEGTFRAGENTHPFTGQQGTLHREPETRIEVILPRHLQSSVLHALLKVHPYEEPAYDIYLLENPHPWAGAGVIGEFLSPLDESSFLNHVKKVTGVPVLRHSPCTGKMIKKVALCGGSGGFLISEALRAGADAFVTADLKYHQFQEGDGVILLVDAGHYETEQFVKEVFYTLITKKIPNFAVHLSEVETNPVKYK